MPEIRSANEIRVEPSVHDNKAGRGRATGLAHDLNNLLTTMIGWAQLARDESVDPSKRKVALETLERSARRARAIAAGYLDGWKSIEAASGSVDLGILVGDVLDLHRLDLEGRGITVFSEFEPGLACAGDPARLFQVLDNLLRNAVEAMPGGGRLRMSVGSLADDRIFAALEDSGPGVDPAVAEAMFDPFVTTKSRAPGSRESGSGLGLDICRRIAREHGGDVIFSPVPGGGARFALELPRTPARPNPVTVADAVSRPSIPPGISVLVVDDEEDICEMVHAALGLRGARVVTATDGEAGLTACRAESFDLALVDYSMRGLSGRALGQALAGLQPDLPLVYMSGDRVDVRGIPQVADFLKKPFDVDDVQRKVCEVLDHRAGGRARG